MYAIFIHLLHLQEEVFVQQLYRIRVVIFCIDTVHGSEESIEQEAVRKREARIFLGKKREKKREKEARRETQTRHKQLLVINFL